MGWTLHHKIASEEIPHAHGCIILHQQSHPRRDRLPQHHPRSNPVPSQSHPSPLTLLHAAECACKYKHACKYTPYQTPFLLHSLDAGQLMKSSFIFHSICRAQQRALAPFACSIFKPFIGSITFACFFSLPSAATRHQTPGASGAADTSPVTGTWGHPH